MRVWTIRWGLLGVLVSAPVAAVTLNQVDDFQDGSIQSWQGGAFPTNVASGGPSGSDDRFLQVSSTGVAPNANLATNNTTQWTGNYSAAGIVRLNFHLNNLGANPLELRVALFGPNGRFTTTHETVLPPASGWVSVDFSLDEASLTQTAGTGTLADTLANVQTLLIRHDPDPISDSGQQNPVVGTLGIDNVTALPEPGLSAQWLTGIAGIAALSRRRRRAS